MSDLRDMVVKECAEVLEQIYKKGTIECGIAFALARTLRELNGSGVDIEDQLSEIIEHLRLIHARLPEKLERLTGKEGGKCRK